MTSERCPAYYTATIAEESNYPKLEGEHEVDIAIIGGGFTGVSSAIELTERGYRVAVIEARKIGWGASGRNGGQITGSLSGQDAMLKQMQRTLGNDAAEFVWNLRWRGHRIIKDRVEKYAIPCDLKHGHLQAAYKSSHIKALKKDFEASQAHSIGKFVQWLDARTTREIIGTNLYHGAIRNDYNMHVHPLNLCLGEARAAAKHGALIFEHSPIIDIEYGSIPVIIGKHGRIKANSVILAGGAYHRLARQKLSGRLFPASLGIVTTAPLSDEVVQAINPDDLAVYDTRFVLDYYRLTADKRLLFGGGANYSGHSSENLSAELRPNIEHTFPQLKGVQIDFEWQGMAGIVLNRIPLIGKLSNNVYYAQGYSGHGIATSHIIGEIMANAISGTLEEFDTFANIKHWRVPLGDRLGNHMLSIGMWYYQLLEKIR